LKAQRFRGGVRPEGMRITRLRPVVGFGAETQGAHRLSPGARTASAPLMVLADRQRSPGVAPNSVGEDLTPPAACAAAESLSGAGGSRLTLSQSPPRRPRTIGQRPSGSNRIAAMATIPSPIRYQPA